MKYDLEAVGLEVKAKAIGTIFIGTNKGFLGIKLQEDKLYAWKLQKCFHFTPMDTQPVDLDQSEVIWTFAKSNETLALRRFPVMNKLLVSSDLRQTSAFTDGQGML